MQPAAAAPVQQNNAIVDVNNVDEFVESKCKEKILLRGLHSTVTVERLLDIVIDRPYYGCNPIAERSDFVCPRDGTIPIEVTRNLYGCRYQVTISDIDRVTGDLVGQRHRFSVRSERSLAEQAAISDLILGYVDADSMRPTSIYRDILAPKEAEILAGGGQFVPTDRMRSGHPVARIFGRFPVIFFNTRSKEAEGGAAGGGIPLPPTSAYGDVRYVFPPSAIIKQDTRALLSDIHCYNRGNRQLGIEQHPSSFSRPHYVSVVLAAGGSEAQRACTALGLRELDLASNPVLRYDRESGALRCASRLRKRADQRFAHELWVEVIVAGCSVPLAEGTRHTVTLRGSDGTHRSDTACTWCHPAELGMA